MVSFHDGRKLLQILHYFDWLKHEYEILNIHFYLIMIFEKYCIIFIWHFKKKWTIHWTLACSIWKNWSHWDLLRFNRFNLKWFYLHNSVTSQILIIVSSCSWFYSINSFKKKIQILHHRNLLAAPIKLILYSGIYSISKLKFSCWFILWNFWIWKSRWK